MAFDPKPHLITLPRRVKNQDTGLWETRHDLYLEVKWRLCWFRDRSPHGSILTEPVLLEWDKGIAIYKATVADGEGGRVTGTGTETRKSFEDFVEKSETRAIGRALAALGIGTQFVGEELSEGEHIADAPVSRNGIPDTNHPVVDAAAQSEGHIGSRNVPPAAVHPTADDITRLVELAQAAHVDTTSFGHDMRRLMQLPEPQNITKKFLRERMTMAQYHTAEAHYREALRRILDEDVPDMSPSPAPGAEPETAAPTTARDPEAAATEALTAKVAG